MLFHQLKVGDTFCMQLKNGKPGNVVYRKRSGSEAKQVDGRAVLIRVRMDRLVFPVRLIEE